MSEGERGKGEKERRREGEKERGREGEKKRGEKERRRKAKRAEITNKKLDQLLVKQEHCSYSHIIAPNTSLRFSATNKCFCPFPPVDQ